MKAEDILLEVHDKYCEWIDMAGEKSPDLIINILCTMVAKERDNNNFIRSIKNVSSYPTNR